MDIAIVGAGLAGLSAATRLAKEGHTVEVFEKGDGPGGRARTDTVDGRALDRGFQILLTAYPEAQALFDYDALDLRSFEPGTLLRHGGEFHRMVDPFRQPKQALGALRAPTGSLRDKLRIASYRRQVLKGNVERLWESPDKTAIERFQSLGFSPEMIDRFLRPLFAGITLDPELTTSSRFTDFIFRMLAVGNAAVPARGIGQLAAQLANKLPEGTVKLNHTVERVVEGHLIVNGEPVESDATILATDISSATELCPDIQDMAWRSVTSVWMSADTPPILDPILTLNGEATDPINSVAVMSRVSPYYSAGGTSTLVVSTPTVRPGLLEDMKALLVEWYGKKTKRWEVLRVDQITKAHPITKRKGRGDGFKRLDGRLWVCGDHTLDPSINGALESGRKAAEAVLAAHESSTAKPGG